MLVSWLVISNKSRKTRYGFLEIGSKVQYRQLRTKEKKKKDYSNAIIKKKGGGEETREIKSKESNSSIYQYVINLSSGFEPN